MKKIMFDKKYSGIFLGILFILLFMGSALWALQMFRESAIAWYVVNSMQRFVFGIVILFICKKIYGRTIRDILQIKGSKKAILAGSGLIIVSIYLLLFYYLAIKAIDGLSVGLFVSHIILQQITTGFYEELNFRVLITEGYFYGPRKMKNKFLYALLSFALFGIAHLVGGGDLSTFLVTGAFGFTYAVMYLNSRNIVMPMIFHFVYDIIANMNRYVVEWKESAIHVALYNQINSVYMCMFVISVVMLFKSEKRTY